MTSIMKTIKADAIVVKEQRQQNTTIGPSKIKPRDYTNLYIQILLALSYQLILVPKGTFLPL